MHMLCSFTRGAVHTYVGPQGAQKHTLVPRKLWGIDDTDMRVPSEWRAHLGEGEGWLAELLYDRKLHAFRKEGRQFGPARKGKRDHVQKAATGSGEGRERATQTETEA